MTIVKELNDLAEKMTGVRPKATTDAQAMDYIEQHYTGGGVEMPTASADTLGGVKVGANLSIDANGVLSATGGGSSIVELDITGQYNFSQESVGEQTAIVLTDAQIQAFKDLASAMGEGNPYPNAVPFYLKYYGQVFNPAYYQYNAFTSKLLIYIVFSGGTDIIHREFEFDVTGETLKYIDRLFEEQDGNNL